MTDAIGDAPPDYAFDYEGVSPWAWQTSDDYVTYAEPIDDGYRYYYYEPGREHAVPRPRSLLQLWLFGRPGGCRL